MLDAAALEQYREKGWLVVEGVFERAEIERIRDLAMRISEEQLEESTASYIADRGENGELAPRKISSPYLLAPEFRQFATDARLKALLGQLMGVEPLLSGDQIFMKPPRFGTAKPYHQDNAYFLCHPADHVVTAWIALDDVDESNGCLRYIDGSHLHGILPHEPIPGEEYNKVPPPELIDLSKESLAIVRQGGVVFHHSQTLHTSHRNESDRWRRGYATHWAAADVTSEGDTIEKSYFNQELAASN
jgi:ectoine hydroxylase-related dioxygenase (phytanoyl-CoA dioxygenase family)